jgi:hypothetical protein
MKKEEAHRSVVHEWDDWAASNLGPDIQGTRTDGLAFFSYLQKHRPTLLNFRNRADKWQTVHGWLLRARKIDN